MVRRALVILVALVALAFSACGGGSNSTNPNLPSDNNGGSGSGTGNGSGSPPPVNVTPDPSPTSTFFEQPSKDTLIGGVAVGSDGNIYASTPNGIDIFGPQLTLLPTPSPLPQGQRIGDTWPAPPHNSPIGPVVSSGSMINALGVQPSPKPVSGAMNLANDPVPAPSSQPLLAQYDITKNAWVNVTLGNMGDKWVSLASPGQGTVFVTGDHLTSNGWVGFLLGFGISCVSPTFTFPLGPSAIGPDGNLWVATNPSLNGKADATANPSILYEINTSTGQIIHTFNLSKIDFKSHVSAIAAGNNAIWFTDDGNNSLGFVPVGGSLNYPNSLPNQGTAQAPVSITRDSIGRMWFVERDGKRVGYATPGTTPLLFTILKVTTRGSPLGIVGCVPGQHCPQTKVFFVEANPATVGGAF